MKKFPTFFSLAFAAILFGCFLAFGLGSWNSAQPSAASSAPEELLDPSALAGCADLSNWQCVETRPGLSLCRANNGTGQICVL